ncbi:MAG TPA: DUF2062 domain-containing protein [Flavobacterium sp.]
MEGSSKDIDRARRLKVCVIIPTYNNSNTLRRVVDSALEFASDIVVINDGSTDETRKILASYANISIIHFASNSGKGMALRAGFKKAAEMGFDYAITIDSDGQHFPSDIPIFLDELESRGEALLIGNRNMGQLGIPKKSSFGNQFSNFWFWVETGIRLLDTQSGFRLYPLNRLPRKFYTRKFEFEIEVIVRTAWKGVPVKNVPINILYDMDERVSHFRPFKDFTRISILNTVLVLNTLFYILPRNITRKFRSKGLKRFLLEDVLNSSDSNSRKACSIALGVFVGVAPIWGVQTIVVLFLAALFRLNKVIAFTFSNVSLPPFVPFIIYSSLIIGSWFFPNAPEVSMHRLFDLAEIKNNIWQYLVGSLILASSLSLIFGFTGYFLLSLVGSKNKK